MSTMQLITPPPWPPPPLQQPPLQQPCKPGICTTTCRQYCNNYFYLQPPPLPQQQFPLLHNPNDSLNSDSDDDSSRSISPLMAALIAVLAAAFLCLFYYTVVSRFCKRRRGGRTNSRRRVLRALDSGAVNNRVDPLVHDPPRPDTGLDEAYIRQITVFRYKRDDGLVEGTECAVCLGEFKEEESLRLMPNCEHAFHIPCIDTWLATHSSCPLCRSTMNPLPARSGDSNAGGAGSVNVSVAALRVERNNDHILVVRELESHGEVVEVVEEERLEEREKENG